MEERIASERRASQTANMARNKPKPTLEERISAERRISEAMCAERIQRKAIAPQRSLDERIAAERQISEAANHARNVPKRSLGAPFNHTKSSNA